MISNREKILNEALNLFSKNGYHGTSMREIAKAVGIKGSSIYNHFDAKEDIFSELFSYLAPLNLKEEDFQAKLLDGEADPFKTLNYFGEIVIEEMQNPKKVKLLKMMVKENNNPVVKKKLQKRMEENVEIISSFFLRLQQEAKIKSDRDAEFLANEFVSSLIYYRMRYLLFELDSYQELMQASRRHIKFFWNKIKEDGID